MLTGSRTTLRFGTVEAVQTGAFDGPAELPRAVPDSTFAWPSGPVYTVKASGGTYTPTQFQQALNTAAAQDSATVLIDPGLTITGSFLLPARSDKPGWVYIASAAVYDGTFPKAPGVRVTPTDAPYMPVLQTPSGGSASVFNTVVGANHSARYRLVGLAITTSVTSGSVTHLVEFNYSPTVTAHCTEDGGVDRCYIYGRPKVNGVKVGVELDCARGFVVDSWIAGIADPNNMDSQAIVALGTPGPLLIHNNYLEAASENVLVGGANQTGRRPEDLTFTRNHVRKPLSWVGVIGGIKNLFELKIGNRILIEGNVLENAWRGAQSGDAFVFKSSGQGGNEPYHQTSNVTVRYNKIRNVETYLRVNAAPTVSTPITSQVHFHDNLFCAPWNGNSAEIVVTGSQTDGLPHNVRIGFNTFEERQLSGPCVSTGSGGGSWTVPPDPTGFWFTDNLLGSPVNVSSAGRTYIYKGIAYLAGTARLKTIYLTPEVERNAAYGLTPPASLGYSATNRWIETVWDDTAFVDPANDNFALKPGHPWKGMADGGRDPGADMSLVLSKTVGVVVTP